MLPEEAPDVFKVKFECSNGDFVVECHKDWAPLGVQRFYELVKSGYYDNSAFFRVVPGFVVQFGLAGDPVMTAAWRNKRLQDDPVKESNLPGTLTFATSGPNTRTTQLFINTGNNARLDGMGFAPFAKVVEGMDVVKTINAEYGERPDQGLITAEGNAYVSRNFPNITLINKASFLQ
ncbi:MAG: peptidylprolyl isomerase [Candidatus Hydrogenedentes bacterium]|nr:peptidylprolyl isomerase [Candidatus Hydrogenedentota bacterium]